jgi:6-phosphogluconolactonase
LKNLKDIINQLNTSVVIFSSPHELAEKFAEEFIQLADDALTEGKLFTVALSGGTTPGLLFSILGDKFSDSVLWKNVHFFWCDERCVPPDDPESNFGTAKSLFLDKILIPSANIHRIKGEKDPIGEAGRYSKEITGFTRKRSGLPLFDLIILGLGEDGHTASIFPANSELLNSEKICDIAFHPLSLQKRITITGKIINNADYVVFLVTGANKAEVIAKIIDKTGPDDYPASHIKPASGALKWYLDLNAAKLISKSKL